MDIMSIDEVAERCDILVDCAPKAIFGEIADAAISRGRILVTVSGAGILANPGIEKRAEDGKARIILATGALLGLDAVRAAAEGTINSVKMITRKPPNALEGAPHIVENNINLEGLNGATRVFEGSARRRRGVSGECECGCRAGSCRDRRRPDTAGGVGRPASRPQHAFDRGGCRQRQLFIQHPECAVAREPGTGKITALSVIACLRGLTQPMKIGS